MNTLDRRIFMCLVIFFFAAAGNSAELSPDVQTTARQLAGAIYIGPSMITLRELTDGFGGRLSGSPAHNRAVDWAVAKFRSMESRSKTGPVIVPNGWDRGPASGKLSACLVLCILNLYWAPSTPPEE